MDSAGRQKDGSAGDANYGEIGHNYAIYRQPDPAIAEFIHSALGPAEQVLNVGAGAGSYEPLDRTVVAVEPSETMRKQRPSHLVQAIDATSEALPFPDNCFAASMATSTIHQWPDLAKGLREMRRVTRGPVVILTSEPNRLREFWLNDYAPGVLAAEARRHPPIAHVAEILGGQVEVLTVPIPLDCKDGFNEAYYGRPEMLLEPGARLACSSWNFVSEQSVADSIARLENDLREGRWDEKYGHLRSTPTYSGSITLVVGQPGD